MRSAEGEEWAGPGQPECHRRAERSAGSSRYEVEAARSAGTYDQWYRL